MDPNLLTTCRGMLIQAQQLGQVPLAYIMNPCTNRFMTDLAAADVKSKQSLFQRALFRARKKHLVLQVFCGVPILQNQYLPDGFVSLQFAPVRSSIAQPPAAAPQPQEQAAGPQPWPFAQQEQPRIQEAPAEDVPTLQDLSKSSGDMPSVTDVLIKALESVDRIKQVVVIRVHDNQDVDMSLNCNQFEATGILEKARVWLAMRER